MYSVEIKVPRGAEERARNETKRNGITRGKYLTQGGYIRQYRL